MSTLYLIRHGHTEVADDGIVAGFTDVKLSSHGEASITKLRTSIDTLHFDHYFSSDLIRAKHSMELLTRVPFQIDERLKELNFGEWEGMCWNDIHEREPEILNTWSSDWVNHSPPGGETFKAVAVRCESWLSEQNTEKNTTTLVTAHGGSIRALLCIALQLPLTMAMRFDIDHASVTQLKLNKSGNRCGFVNGSSFRQRG